MTLKECYLELGGDYEDVLSRLSSEKVVRLLMHKFLEDESFASLTAAMEAKRPAEAFRAVHTLKGVCQNLGFVRLYESSRALTELLRAGSTTGTALSMRRVTSDYQRVTEAINKYEADNRAST